MGWVYFWVFCLAINIWSTLTNEEMFSKVIGVIGIIACTFNVIFGCIENFVPENNEE